MDATANAVLGQAADPNTGRSAMPGLKTIVPQVLQSTEKLTRSVEDLKTTVRRSNDKLEQHLVDDRKTFASMETRLNKLERAR